MSHNAETVVLAAGRPAARAAVKGSGEASLGPAVFRYMPGALTTGVRVEIRLQRATMHNTQEFAGNPDSEPCSARLAGPKEWATNLGAVSRHDLKSTKSLAASLDARYCFLPSATCWASCLLLGSHQLLGCPCPVLCAGLASALLCV